LELPAGVTTALGYWAVSSFGDQSAQGACLHERRLGRANPDTHAPLPQRLERLEQKPPGHGHCLRHRCTSGVAGVDINGGGASFSASSDGVYTLTATATDKAGTLPRPAARSNWIPPRRCSRSTGCAGWSERLVRLAGGHHRHEPDATSGIASTQIQVDGGAWQNGASFNEGTDGTHTLVFRARIMPATSPPQIP